MFPLLVLYLSFCFVFEHNVQATGRGGVCETDWSVFKSSCYSWHSQKPTTLNEARNLCENLNSSLVRVVTNETYRFIKENLLKKDVFNFWSGLHRCHMSLYFWTDGTPLRFERFKTGEPNNYNDNEHCVEIYADATWNDQDCSKTREFICQNLTCLRIKSKPSHSCLYASERKSTWSKAKQLCQDAGDTLVKIANAEMNFAVMRLANKKENGCWIGLQKRDELCWGNNEKAVLEKGRGSCRVPSGGCGCVSMGDGWKWVEVACDEKQAFVCEKGANECEDVNNKCHNDSVCINTAGSYICQCRSGFIGNGIFCVEPNNFEVSMMNMTDENEVKTVIKSCARELEIGSDSETVLKMLENLTLSIGEHLKKSRQATEFILKEKNMNLGVVVIKEKELQSFTYPNTVHSSTKNGENIVFPGSIVPSGIEDSAVVVGMIYDTPNEMRSTDKRKWFINSKIVAGIVNPKPHISPQNPVKIVFKKLQNVLDTQVQCVYWTFRKGMKGTWSTDGCHVSNSNESHVTCECYHLTNFAILMRIETDKEQISDEDGIVLNIITFVGLSTSIIGCFLTLVIHLSFRKLRRDRGFIHINLVLALGLADVVFMIAILSDPHDTFCTVIAMLTFYFFLALFFWMFVEGLHIYFMVTKVFDTKGRKMKISYSIIGWILPLLIVCVTFGALRSDVLSDDHCWLSISSGAIWAFVGPITFIILVNIFIMILVLKLTFTMLPEDPENGKISSAFRTFLMLAPILGVTWIFGVLTITKYSTVFQYLFAILNSFQGFIIFILYCFFNKEARKELKRKINIMRSCRDITLSKRKSSFSNKNKMSLNSSKSSLGSSSKKASGDNPTSGRYTPRNDQTGVQTNVNYGLDNEHPSPEIYRVKNT